VATAGLSAQRDILSKARFPGPIRCAVITRVLVSLNHPNIAQIYGIEQGALVMETVGGGRSPTELP
jgi:hypothetical protein